jgi:hypothetical protein
VSGAAFGLPADMRRCGLCSVVLWTWWETPDGRSSWCTDCALVVSAQRELDLAAHHGPARRRNAG